MDFIEGIGERYLMGKANAAPGMLENLAKKQFTSATDTRAQAAQASTLPSSEKDEEIAKLRKQLAETKLDKGKATGEAKLAKSKAAAAAAASSAKSVKSTKSKPSISVAKSSGGSAKARAEKEMKGLPSLSIAAPKDHKKKALEATRGRRASTSTATTTAQPHNYAPSEAKSGGHVSSSSATSSKPGKLQGLEALGARDALQGARYAASSASSAHASGNRKHEMESAQSEVGSVRGSNAAVVATRPPPLFDGSQHGGRAAAPRPPPQAVQAVHHPSRGQTLGYEEVVRKPRERYGDEEPGMYVVEVEVEEDTPIRRKSARQRGTGRGGDGDGGVVEVLSSKGRKVYRVSY